MVVNTRSQTMDNSRLQDSAIGHPLNKVDVLVETSRTFCIGEKQYEFVETESIFFMEGPLNPRNYHNTPEGCHTCGDPWKKASDLQNSHCQFCGNSNCKQCLKKTRPFKSSGKRELDKSGREIKERGSICLLCDRKFLVKGMVQDSLEEISAHNVHITSSLKQQEDFKA